MLVTEISRPDVILDSVEKRAREHPTAQELRARRVALEFGEVGLKHRVPPANLVDIDHRSETVTQSLKSVLLKLWV